MVEYVVNTQTGVLTMPPRRMPLEQKFEINTRREGECIVWTGKRDRNGYGLVSLERQKWSFAHRAAWFLAHGEWPSGVILHSCDNPACVNLDHLSDGSAADNMRDAIQKGRLDNRGERHGMSKLSNDDARQIRDLYLGGSVTQIELARKFGVSQPTISEICSRRHWGHL